MASRSGTDLTERSFQFAVRIVKLCSYIFEKNRDIKPLGNQLLRSGTSIGANIEEAQGAQSKADFLAKYHIALKEARETSYWLRLLIAAELLSEKRIKPILNECTETTKILASSIISTKAKEK